MKVKEFVSKRKEEEKNTIVNWTSTLRFNYLAVDVKCTEPNDSSRERIGRGVSHTKQ